MKDDIEEHSTACVKGIGVRFHEAVRNVYVCLLKPGPHFPFDTRDLSCFPAELIPEEAPLFGGEAYYTAIPCMYEEVELVDDTLMHAVRCASIESEVSSRKRSDFLHALKPVFNCQRSAVGSLYPVLSTVLADMTNCWDMRGALTAVIEAGAISRFEIVSMLERRRRLLRPGTARVLLAVRRVTSRADGRVAKAFSERLMGIRCCMWEFRRHVDDFLLLDVSSSMGGQRAFHLLLRLQLLTLLLGTEVTEAMPLLQLLKSPSRSNRSARGRRK